MNMRTQFQATFVIAASLLLATPSLAQHGGHMGDGEEQHGHHDTMTHQMGDMHHPEMMEQMTVMMDHMTEMMQEMQGLEHQMDGMWQEPMGGELGEHQQSMEMMHGMAQGMEEMMPHMETMLDQMHTFMSGADHGGMESVSEPMQEFMSQMESMMEAGRDVMRTIRDMAHAGTGGNETPEHNDHSGHQR